MRSQAPPIFNHNGREGITLDLTTLRVLINFLTRFRFCGCSRLRDPVSQIRRHGRNHGAHVEEEFPLLLAPLEDDNIWD